VFEYMKNASSVLGPDAREKKIQTCRREERVIRGSSIKQNDEKTADDVPFIVG
jgi:hypothetical protein